MSLLIFTALLFFGSLLAGLLGALTGLGGGVVLVPLLTLGFHVDIRYAIGVSLISVIATSSGAAAAYVREGFSSVRIGMFLEVATTIGAILGSVSGDGSAHAGAGDHLWVGAGLLGIFVVATGAKSATGVEEGKPLV